MLKNRQSDSMDCPFQMLLASSGLTIDSVVPRVVDKKKNSTIFFFSRVMRSNALGNVVVMLQQ